MSNQHKHPTISFRISDAERKQIEARILTSGMMKKDYFVRSCIYNHICVVGNQHKSFGGQCCFKSEVPQHAGETHSGYPESRGSAGDMSGRGRDCDSAFQFIG